MRWLTAAYGANSMNVTSMRMHTSLRAARRRMEQLVQENMFVALTRCYEFSDTDAPPENITNKMGLKDKKRI
jgi:hypothetical protein